MLTISVRYTGMHKGTCAMVSRWMDAECSNFMDVVLTSCYATIKFVSVVLQYRQIINAVAAGKSLRNRDHEVFELIRKDTHDESDMEKLW